MDAEANLITVREGYLTDHLLTWKTKVLRSISRIKKKMKATSNKKANDKRRRNHSKHQPDREIEEGE